METVNMTWKRDVKTWRENVTWKRDVKTWRVNVPWKRDVKRDVKTWRENVTWKRDVKTWRENVTWKRDVKTWRENVTWKRDVKIFSMKLISFWNWRSYKKFKKKCIFNNIKQILLLEPRMRDIIHLDTNMSYLPFSGLEAVNQQQPSKNRILLK